MTSHRPSRIPERDFLFALTLFLACACGEPSSAPLGPPNVVLICLDTVRADHLGAYGYGRDTTPALDALATRSIVFADASATAGWTKPSVPSFLTSTYPCQHGVYEGSAHDEAGAVTDLLPRQALTLAEAFQKGGYHTGAFVNNAQLRAGNGFEQGFDAYEQSNMDAREIRWRGTDWIDRWREGRGGGKAPGAQRAPFFLYLHFLDAHWPYAAPEEWTTRYATAAATERFRGKESKALYASINDGDYQMTAADRTALEALYDGALAYLDSELGRFLAALELRGLAENTIVCVIADHGEEFGEHEKVGHGHGLWENLLRVPWILHVPGRPAQRNEAPVSLIDLFPTLIAAAGLPPSQGLEGIDRLADPSSARPILAEHKGPDRYQQSLRVASEKLRRLFRPPESAAAADVVLPIANGTRWEAEFTVEGAEFVARQLKPRDEELSDPPELKGRVHDLGPEEFRIAGIRVHYDEKSVRQTDIGTNGPALANDLIVKVRGPYQNGVLHAERIKFYPPEESEQLEIRATVERVEQSQGSGVLTMGGFLLRFSHETELKGVDWKPKGRKLSRQQVAELLAAGASTFAAGNQYESTRELHDLTRDRAELAPRTVTSESPLDQQLDQLGAALSQKRLFGARDQKALDAEALKELQDIGYGGGEH